MTTVTATEYDTNVRLTCTAHSKPVSVFKWYRVGNNSVLIKVQSLLAKSAENMLLAINKHK